MPCRLCHSDRSKVLADFGPQPIGNRFLVDREESEDQFPLALSVCFDCGLAQLDRGVPVETLTPRFDWITYVEPEDHLDDTAAVIAGLEGLSPDSGILGLTFKDDSLLARLNRLGFPQVDRVNPAVDLELPPTAGIERIQQSWTRRRAAALLQRRTRPTVVIARHVVEHAEDFVQFLAGLRELLPQNGYLVLEVPDCTRAFAHSDCVVMWEEHLMYFTPQTFVSAVERVGFEIILLKSYEYALENSLLAIARPRDGSAAPTGTGGIPAHVRDEQIALVQSFVNGLGPRRQDVRRRIHEFRKVGPVALLGAGHLGCTFLNFMQLQDEVQFVVDDNPKKQGLFMPGSRLPIRSPDALMQDSVRTCLLAVQPGSENAVIARNQPWVEQGGVFASIFAASRRGLTTSSNTQAAADPHHPQRVGG